MHSDVLVFGLFAFMTYAYLLYHLKPDLCDQSPVF